MMESTNLVGYGAIGLSSVAMLSVVCFMPILYQEASDLHADIMHGMRDFKMQTDFIWRDLVTIRSSNGHNHFAISSIADMFSRKKRQSGACECDINNTCPPGSPGSNGDPGIDGEPGMNGDTGKPGQPGMMAFVQEVVESGCRVCPVGPPGNGGPPGPGGPPGNKGQPGTPAIAIGIGQPGPPGSAGGNGTPGSSGQPGPKGPPGRDGSNGKGIPGPKGSPGAPGTRGVDGPSGTQSRPGTPGGPGPRGPPGPSGNPGGDGSPGGPGTDGDAGNDAQYCPCPIRKRRQRLQQRVVKIA